MTEDLTSDVPDLRGTSLADLLDLDDGQVSPALTRILRDIDHPHRRRRRLPIRHLGAAMTMLEQILTAADTLTEPHINREPYTVWTGQRHRKTHHHITVQHGLITQLYRAVLPTWTTTDGAGGGIPASRPPLEVEALSRHNQIAAAAAGWCRTLHIHPRITAESNIRGIAGAANHLDNDQAKQLLADLRRWAGWCRVYLGLEHVRQIAGVRCPLPDCADLGTLRINLTTETGLCRACGATWDRDTIGVLAEHITTSRTTTAREAAEMGA